MDKMLLALLILSQTLIFPALSFRWCKELTAQVFILATICYLVWKKNKFLSAFMLWSVAQFFIFKSFIINDYQFNPSFKINILAFLNIINVILYGLFYYVLHEIKIDKKLIYKTFCIIATFQAGYAILQWLQLDQFFLHYSSLMDSSCGPIHKVYWPVGTWANEALVSWCIVLCSPFFLAFKELRYKLGYALCFIAILCAKTTAGILGFVVGFLFWLWFKDRKLASTLIVALLIIGTLLYSSGKLNYFLSDTHRFKVWAKTIEIWKNTNPVIGNGLGSFRVMFVQIAPEFKDDGHWAQAHNEYLQVLFEQGIVGLLMMMGLMWMTFYNFIKTKRGLIPITSLAILTVIMITGFPMRTAIGIIPLFALVFAEKEMTDG